MSVTVRLLWQISIPPRLMISSVCLPDCLFVCLSVCCHSRWITLVTASSLLPVKPASESAVRRLFLWSVRGVCPSISQGFFHWMYLLYMRRPPPPSFHCDKRSIEMVWSHVIQYPLCVWLCFSCMCAAGFFRRILWPRRGRAAETAGDDGEQQLRLSNSRLWQNNRCVLHPHPSMYTYIYPL